VRNFLASADPDGDDPETRTALIDEAVLKQIENSSNTGVRLHHAACKKRHYVAWLLVRRSPSPLGETLRRRSNCASLHLHSGDHQDRTPIFMQVHLSHSC